MIPITDALLKDSAEKIVTAVKQTATYEIFSDFSVNP